MMHTWLSGSMVDLIALFCAVAGTFFFCMKHFGEKRRPRTEEKNAESARGSDVTANNERA